MKKDGWQRTPSRWGPHPEDCFSKRTHPMWTFAPSWGPPLRRLRVFFLNGDADVGDFVHHFTPDMRKVAPLIGSLLMLSMSDSARPVIHRLYDAEAKWCHAHDIDEQSSTLLDKGDEFMTTAEKMADNVNLAS